MYHCPCCDLYLDRDENAALNILTLGVQGLQPDSSGLIKAPCL